MDKKLNTKSTIKESLSYKEKMTELKIDNSMDYETISHIITKKLIDIVRKNVC